MIAVIKTSPKCEAILKQGQEREQIKRQLFGPLRNGSNSFECDFIHLFIQINIYWILPVYWIGQDTEATFPTLKAFTLRGKDGYKNIRETMQ